MLIATVDNAEITLLTSERCVFVYEDGSEEGTPRNDSGTQHIPMRNASEKLRVERVARNMPRRSREKHLTSSLA